MLKAAGIRPARIEGVPPGAVPRILRLPNWLFRRVAERMLAIDPEARSSMWEDLERRRPTEIDYLQGAILALAAKTRVRAPLTERIVRLVKEAEAARAGSPGLTPEQVRIRSGGMKRAARPRARPGGSAMDADVIVVGGGLAGLVATAELIDAGKRVILLDQEPEQSLGGQAFWSFGGLMFVDSPEQRRLRIRDSHDLALQDWMGSAGFDRDGGPLAAQVGRGLRRISPPARSGPGCTRRGVRWFPIVGWAERGGYLATEHGNSVPRFHVTWGTGPAIIAPFVRARARGGQGGPRVAALPPSGE